MAVSGYQTPVGKIVVKGDPYDIRHLNVESNTSLLPGKLLEEGTSSYDVIAHSGDAPPIGWLGFEHTVPNNRPATIATAPAAAKEHSVLAGGNFLVYAMLAIGSAALQGDSIYSWEEGNVVAGYELDGRNCVRVPFSKNASEADTGLDVPANVVIHWAAIEVTTAVGSGTIDVGLGNGTESGFDADGLMDASLTSVAGINPENNVDATAGNITGQGALNVEVEIKDATGTPVFTGIFLKPGLKCDGTLVSLSYTTSNHTMAGYILLAVSGPGIKKVGICAKAVTASSSALQRIFVRSDL